MGVKLFDGSDDDVEDISKIEVDKEFAKRYQHNKEREDLQRYEELKKKGLAEGPTSSNDDSESLGEELDSAGEKDEIVDFFDKLAKVKAGDPALKDKECRLFDYASNDSDEDEGEEGGKGENGNKREKKEKKKYLKDVNAEHLMELGPEFGGEDDDDEEEGEEDVKKVKTYSEEQEELRKEFLNAVEEAEGEDGGGGDLLRMKSKDDEEEEEEGTEEVKEKLDEYFGKDEQLDEKDLYLKKFFENRLWIDKEKGKKPIIDEDEIPVSDDEEEIERQEDYEREFNFRFEEGAGDRVQSHSRIVDDSVRKKNATRKEQRKRKKERMEQAEVERQEEVKRLKNLKKKEILEKINKIKLVAGLSDGLDIPLTEADLEEEFDPEKYDKQMKDAFGKQYYDAEDVDSDFGSDKDEGEGDLEKPDFEKEDELLGLPKDWDVVKPGDGFSSERQKYLETLKNNEGDEEEEKEEELNGEEDEEQPVEGKRKRKRKMSLKEKITLDKDLEELYKLDYEDTIGDLKTRFKYKEVAPKRYGLSAEEILALDDKELNQVVSVKRLAPYREKEWKVPHTKLMAVKKKVKEQEPSERRSGKDEGKHKKRKTEEHSRNAAEDGDNLEGMSRKEKRKRRKAELKISESRLMAYGKIPSKSKSKSKH